MENLSFKYKMLGVVTLYNPEICVVAENIRLYANSLDALIVWDNSPLRQNVQQRLLEALPELTDKIIWHGTGENLCIAPAINYAWHYAREHGFDLLLTMDQDSRWANFSFYRERVEHYYADGNLWAFAPYVAGNDTWAITDEVHFRRVLITSGAVFPIKILNAIDGADLTFPLDALDHDLAIRLQKAGYKIACITSSVLYHTIGRPQKDNFMHLFTNDYGRERTYSIAKSHLIKYRKHKDWFTCYEKRRIFKEYYMWKFIRIVLVEHDKWGRLKMLCKGIKDGFSYDLSKTKR